MACQFHSLISLALTSTLLRRWTRSIGHTHPKSTLDYWLNSIWITEISIFIPKRTSNDCNLIFKLELHNVLQALCSQQEVILINDQHQKILGSVIYSCIQTEVIYGNGKLETMIDQGLI